VAALKFGLQQTFEIDDMPPVAAGEKDLISFEYVGGMQRNSSDFPYP
jgi:hypothetical protein